MPQMTTPEELFVHELEDMYYAENALVKTLPKLAEEASDRELAQAFEQHLDQTKTHVANLERVFEELGKPASGEQCPGIDGIKEEHDTFMKENEPNESVRDLFLTGAGARAEHYEIAAYTGLVAQAKALGETDSAKLLKANLEQEKEALETVESISQRLLETAAQKASVS
jgi:ferritin-like metal-binding protein YciE